MHVTFGPPYSVGPRHFAVCRVLKDVSGQSDLRRIGLVMNRLVSVIANRSRMIKVEQLIRCEFLGNRFLPSGLWPKLRLAFGHKS